VLSPEILPGPLEENLSSWSEIRPLLPQTNILNLVQEKKFQVIIDRSFPLAEARAAQRHLEERGHFGKVVLKMS
jgi:NADPH:quinone reductase-like Zn-dependent oxidoreductase